MFFTDTEHRMLLASLSREKAHLLENPEFEDLVSVIANIERKISELQHNREGHWYDVNANKSPKEGEQVLVKLGRYGTYSLCKYTNDLYSVDKYDFPNEQGKAGFYCYDSHIGYYPLENVVKWMRIPKEVNYV